MRRVLRAVRIVGFTCSLALGVLASGAAADTVPGLPTITLPTITVPTLPTVTVPTLPKAPPPLRPPPPPPPLRVPPLDPLEPPPIGRTRTPVATPHGSGQPGDGAPRTSGTSGTRQHAPTRLTRLRAFQDRASRRGGRKKTTVIAFRLSRPGRVLFLVRSPDCRTVATFVVRGHRGRNEVRLPRAMRRHPLQPGRYAVGPVRVRRSPVHARPVGIAVGAFGVSPARVEMNCGGGSAETTGLQQAPPGGTHAAPVPQPDRESVHKTARPKGVLGAIKSLRPRSLPTPGSDLPWPLGLAALTVLVLVGGAILAYILRFTRRPDTI
jgi:hypothetical protein